MKQKRALYLVQRIPVELDYVSARAFFGHPRKHGHEVHGQKMWVVQATLNHPSFKYTHTFGTAWEWTSIRENWAVLMGIKPKRYRKAA